MPDCMVNTFKGTAEGQGKQTLDMELSGIKKFPLSNGKCLMADLPIGRIW